MPTRILLVDDHRVMLDSLRAMLNQESDMEVVGMAENGRVAISMVNELNPDVVVMDIGMPYMNGIDATEQIVQDYPKVKVVALSTYTDKKYIASMLKAGAHGYVSKETAGDELLIAVRKVRQGLKYLSSNVTESVVDGYVNQEVNENAAMAQLGTREREILQLIAEGLTSGQIAAHLHISTNTVDTHRRNIMKKLDMHSIADLTKYAVREGLTLIKS